MTTEIEELRGRKEAVKCELQAEEQKERSLQEEIEILEEKIAVRDLERKLETKRESVKQFELRKSKLQDEWNQPNEDTKKDEEPKEPSPELIVNTEPAHNGEPIQSVTVSNQKKHRFF